VLRWKQHGRKTNPNVLGQKTMSSPQVVTNTEHGVQEYLSVIESRDMEDSIAPSQEATLESAPHSSHAASADGRRSFSSQHLACVLSAAVSSRDAMMKFVSDLKKQSDYCFKTVQGSTRVEGQEIKFKKEQIAERIAKCRPDGVTDAEGLLSWLVEEKKMLIKEDLRKAMSKLEPAIEWVQRDKLVDLIKKIVEGMRTREVAASVDVSVYVCVYGCARAVALRMGECAGVT
jgi:hypothetical protein